MLRRLWRCPNMVWCRATCTQRDVWIYPGSRTLVAHKLCVSATGRMVGWKLILSKSPIQICHLLCLRSNLIRDLPVYRCCGAGVPATPSTHRENKSVLYEPSCQQPISTEFKWPSKRAGPYPFHPYSSRRKLVGHAPSGPWSALEHTVSARLRV